MSDIVQITVRDFIENIRKNGLPKARHYLFATDETVGNDIPSALIIKSCAFGQGLINTGAFLDVYSVQDEFMSNFYSRVWNLNDDLYKGYSLGEIADLLTKIYRDDLDRVLTFQAFDYTPFLPAIHEGDI